MSAAPREQIREIIREVDNLDRTIHLLTHATNELCVTEPLQNMNSPIALESFMKTHPLWVTMEQDIARLQRDMEELKQQVSRLKQGTEPLVG